MSVSQQTFDLSTGEFSEIEVPDEPSPEMTPEQLLAGMGGVSIVQITAAMAALGFITKEEARAWALNAILPAEAQAYIDAIPDEAERFVAEMRAAKPSTVLPTNPLVGMFAAQRGMGATELLELFGLAQSL